MSAWRTLYPSLTGHVKKLRGACQPILASADDGQQYVVKFFDNPHGRNVLFNECCGNLLYRACGLAVAGWQTVRISSSFIEENRDCWMTSSLGKQAPRPGLCFASHFLGRLRIFEILAGSSMGRVANRKSFWLAWLLDRCAAHSDNRQAIFCDTAQGYLAIFIDHGDMFGGPNGEAVPHPIAPRYLDDRIYTEPEPGELRTWLQRVEQIDTEQLWEDVVSIPEEWRCASGLSHFAECLNRLHDHAFLQRTLDELVELQRRSIERRNGLLLPARKPPQRCIPEAMERDRLKQNRWIGAM
jgi:hypothetical protein